MAPSHLQNTTVFRWWSTVLVATSLCILLVVRPSSLQQQQQQQVETTRTTAILLAPSSSLRTPAAWSSREQPAGAAAVRTPHDGANTTTTTTLYLPLYTPQGLCLHRQPTQGITVGPCNDDTTTLLRFAFDAILTENLYQLRTMHGNVCLDATTATPSALQLTPCTTITTLDQTDTSSQLWSVMGGDTEQQQYYYLHSVGHRGQCVAIAAAAESAGLAECRHSTGSTNTTTASLLTLPRPPSATYGPAPITTRGGREHSCLDATGHWVDCHSTSSSQWQALVFDHHASLLLFPDHDTVYQFRSTRTGLCLGLNDVVVNTVPCDTSQIGTFWRIHGDKGDMVSSQADPGLCWDTTSTSTVLQVAPCSFSTSSSSSSTTMVVRALQQQQVFLGPTPIVRFDGTCWQATSSSDSLTEEDCNDTPAQQFRLGPTSTNNEFLIQSVTTGACVVREGDEDAVTTTGPCDASNANAVWTLTGGDVQNDATASTTIANNDQCITSPFTFRQSGILGLLFRILNWFLDLFRNLFERERRVQLGSCTDAAAQNTISLRVQRDPWLGPIQTALVASAMANRPDGTYPWW